MKIWIHRYQLEPIDSNYAVRSGALVKIEWAVGQIGFSDLHPWPEYDEPPLDDHIASLAKVQFTPLAQNSIAFNYIDREFRLVRRNAFAGLILPRSHRLVTDIKSLEPQQLGDWQKQGFSHIKVKMGHDLTADTQALMSLAYATTLLWRLDFNGRLSAAEFAKWWESLDEAVRRRVDFVEDPTNGEQMKIAGPWANDWREQERALIRIVKPAREDSEELARYDRVVFTHGMDHSFGQACAAWSAARYFAAHPKKLEVCGLAAPSLYKPNVFSQQWHCEGPRVKPTTGTGFGFDELLADIQWERIL